MSFDMSLKIHPDLRERFPELQVFVRVIHGLKVEKRNTELENFAAELIQQVKQQYDLDSLKDTPTFRAYRDFFWRVGIDPTKNRPAAEALIRRILGSKPMPSINTLVDAYNLASIASEVALAAFDIDRLEGDLLMRFAESGEKFLGIGMDLPMELAGGEIVISDAQLLVAVYPYRDAEHSKVTLTTRGILLLVCGVPGIDEARLEKAANIAVEYVTRFCRGP